MQDQPDFCYFGGTGSRNKFELHLSKNGQKSFELLTNSKMTTRDSEEGFNLELKSIRESHLERRREHSIRSAEDQNPSKAIVPENSNEERTLNYVMVSGVERKSEEFTTLLQKIRSNDQFRVLETVEEAERVLPDDESPFDPDQLAQPDPPRPRVFLLLNRYKRSKKLLFALCRGIPVLSLLKIKAVEANYQAFPREFKHFFFSPKRAHKVDFETLFEERRKRGKGLLRDYDFVLSEDLQNFKNLRQLVEAAGGRIARIFDQFNRKGISNLVDFLGTFLGHGDPQYVELPKRGGRRRAHQRNASQTNKSKLHFQSLPQRVSEAREQPQSRRPLVVVFRQNISSRKMRSSLLVHNFLKRVILCQEELFINSLEQQNLLFLNKINF